MSLIIIQAKYVLFNAVINIQLCIIYTQAGKPDLWTIITKSHFFGIEITEAGHSTEEDIFIVIPEICAISKFIVLQPVE